jgi:hypothetical protein
MGLQITAPAPGFSRERDSLLLPPAPLGEHEFREHFDPLAPPNPQKPRAVAVSLDLISSEGPAAMRLDIEGEPPQLISRTFHKRAEPYKLELLGHIVDQFPEPVSYLYVPLDDERWFEVTVAQLITINVQGQERVVSPVQRPFMDKEDARLRNLRAVVAASTWLEEDPTRAELPPGPSDYTDVPNRLKDFVGEPNIEVVISAEKAKHAKRQLWNAIKSVATWEGPPLPKNLTRGHLADARGCSLGTINNYLSDAGKNVNMQALKKVYRKQLQKQTAEPHAL